RIPRFFVHGEEAAQLARAAGNLPLLATARSREHDRKLDAPGLGRLRGPLKAIRHLPRSTRRGRPLRRFSDAANWGQTTPRYARRPSGKSFVMSNLVGQIRQTELTAIF